MSNEDITISPAARWGRLAIGLCLLAGVFAFFASGYTPPGVCGEVVRHNQQAGIDASPFFYGDVDNMLELIEAAEELRSAVRLNRDNSPAAEVSVD